jgi:4-hydroxy-3-polyprenylbenzoate decarboxylase
MASKSGVPGGTAPSRDYPDLHEHLRDLDEAGLLVTVDIPINKDTQLHALVRWQYCGGIPETDWKAFLFTNVTDAKGRTYDIPVAVGAIAASRRVLSRGLGCADDGIRDALLRGLSKPIPPRVVDNAPCHEIVVEGAELDATGAGLDGLPVPISTPGWDNGPYLSTSAFVTKDPDTGVQNLGVYRAQVKATRRLGMNPSAESRPGGLIHWEKYKALGRPMPCAVVVGAPPVVAYAGIQKVPETMDEIAVAGGVVGSPINVVPARTVDLNVPAEAEIVIEGFVNTEYLEPEAPFGESHGHVNLQEYNAFMDVTCITRRSEAVLTSFISQVSPSESSVMIGPVQEAIFLRHLRDVIGIKGIQRVAAHTPLTGGRVVLFLVFDRDVPGTEIWRALYAAASLHGKSGKILIAVNDDIETADADAILWAMAFRARPHLDMQILPHRGPGHAPSDHARGDEDSALLVDATLKGDMPPIALPKRQYMEEAKAIWEDRLGLPTLHPKAPWYGYDLGAWNEELDRQAQLAVAGDYWEVGRLLAQRRRNDVAMNQEVRFAAPEEE